MHVIFGVSSLVMLVGTIWMLAKDHNREWRQWQLDDRARERWTAEAQLAQAEADSTAKLEDLRSQLAAAQSSKIDAELVSRFRAARRGRGRAAGASRKTNSEAADFGGLEQSLSQLEERGERQRRSGRGSRRAACDALERFVREARRRESTLLSEKKFLAADQTAAVSARGLAVGEGQPTGEIETQIQELADKIQTCRCGVRGSQGLPPCTGRRS